jgi:hypothetical protein
MGSHLSHEVFYGVHGALCTIPSTTTSKLALGHTDMICAAEQVGYVLTDLISVPKIPGFNLSLGID